MILVEEPYIPTHMDLMRNQLKRIHRHLSDYSLPTSFGKQHSGLLHGQVLSKPAEDTSTVNLEPSYPPTHELPLMTARMIDDHLLKCQSRHRQDRGHQMEGILGRPITSEGMIDENFERRSLLGKV